MGDVEKGQEIDPLQDEGVGEFDADADTEAEVSLDDTVEGEAAVGQDAGIEDPVCFLFWLDLPCENTNVTLLETPDSTGKHSTFSKNTRKHHCFVV